jgi:hypothetical protein
MVGFVPKNPGRWGLLGIYQGDRSTFGRLNNFCEGIGNGVGTQLSNAAAPAPSTHEA